MYTNYFIIIINYYIRPIIKWFLRKTTGLCELQRLCYGELSGAPRVLAVERSLNQSFCVQIKLLIRHLDDISDNRRLAGANEREILRGAVNTVLLVKKINPQVHVQFVKSFGRCIEQIWGYKQLVSEVETLRKTVYDPDNKSHEATLFLLWNKLMPDEKLSGRITKQWQLIGFQGDDPKTDFRGMGLLGLENLLYFASEFKIPCSHVLSHSLHPKYGYDFAVVGINLTSMAWKLLKSGHAKAYVFNTSKSLPTMRLFHHFYSYIFFEFDKYWIESKPKNIMEFSTIRDRFEQNIQQSLLDTRNVFRINISIDTI